jgi:cyanophycin synthetase
VLETAGARARDADAIAAWHAGVERMRTLLGWPAAAIVARVHAGGTALALAAPPDQLFAATEVNEWAWLAAIGANVLHAPGHPPAWDEPNAIRCLRALAAAEADPALRALLALADAHALPVLLDDEMLTIGLGAGARSWPLTALPRQDDVPWADLHAVPTALVTGSNGKTTTVRLLAAMLRAQGLASGFSCTDGVFVAGQRLHGGDWSGPAGARAVLRDARVQAAVLETARGGLMRRGLALARADVAVVTNVSADHFGEYGIHDLAGLAAAKLTVARALDADGVLVLNADDDVLAACADAGVPTGRDGTAARIAWFALDDAHPRLQQQRAAGSATCGVHNGVLRLSAGGQVHGLADIAAMPLAAGGVADYNIGNAAAASLLAHALGVPPPVIVATLASFGRDPEDNAGRLQRWHFGGVQVLMDYAHNPDGLRGLLLVARAAGDGRIGLLLGQAGNRPDDDVRALAAVAANAKPARIVLKDIDGFLRGRAPGEVAAILAAELRARDVPDADVCTVLPELDAARTLLQWARPGDVLVMPVHALSARATVSALLDDLRIRGWQAGDELP